MAIAWLRVRLAGGGVFSGRDARLRSTSSHRVVEARHFAEEHRRCPACGLTLPVAILMPRHCPRCRMQTHELIELEPFTIEGRPAGAGVRI